MFLFCLLGTGTCLKYPYIIISLYIYLFRIPNVECCNMEIKVRFIFFLLKVGRIKWIRTNNNRNREAHQETDPTIQDTTVTYHFSDKAGNLDNQAYRFAQQPKGSRKMKKCAHLINVEQNFERVS
jgi:hypothetical protein